MSWVNDFSVYIFDCDGVILDSNEIKSQAFYDSVVQKEGVEVAQLLRQYNKDHGGISRYKKFSHFFYGDKMESYLKCYSELCFAGLLKIDEIAGFKEFISQLNPELCYVVSGGDEDELKSIFSRRGLSGYFASIFGSPESKENILAKLKTSVDLTNGVYFGDSKIDYLAAKTEGMSFVFLCGSTEFEDWKSYFRDKEVMIFKDFTQL